MSTSMSSFIHWPKSSCQYFVNATQRNATSSVLDPAMTGTHPAAVPLTSGRRRNFVVLSTLRRCVAFQFHFRNVAIDFFFFSVLFCFVYLLFFFFLRLRFLSSFWVWRSSVHGQGQTPATLKQWKRWKASVEITQQLTNPFNTVHLNAASLTERSSARQFNLDSNDSIDSFD